MSATGWLVWAVALCVCLSLCGLFLSLVVVEVRRGAALDASALEVEGAAL